MHTILFMKYFVSKQPIPNNPLDWHYRKIYEYSWQAIIVHHLMLKIINYEHVFLEQCVRWLSPLTYIYYHHSLYILYMYIGNRNYSARSHHYKPTTPSFHKLSHMWSTPPHQKFNVRAPQILAKNPRKMSCMHEYFSKMCLYICSAEYDER